MLLNNYTHHQETILKWLMALGQDIPLGNGFYLSNYSKSRNQAAD